MGLHLASAFISIFTDGSQARSELASLESAYISTLESIERAALGILGGIAAASSAAIVKGLQEAGEYEQRFLAMEVLLGDAEEAQSLFGKLEDLALKTPFEMGEIVKASQTMVQFGERGDQVIDSLTFLGNAASATNSRFGDIALIYNQIRGATKLLRGDFNQLATRGVLSMQDLADHFGVSMSEVSDMMSRGKISFEDVREILQNLSKEGGRYFNMMERQSQTFMGSIAKLKDAVSLSLLEVGRSFIDIATKITNGLAEAVEMIKATMKATGDLIPNIMATTVAVSTLTAAVLSLRVGLKLLGVTWKGLLIGSGVGIVLLAAAAAAGALLTALQRLYRYTIEGLSGLTATTDTLNNLRAAWQIFSTTIVSIFEGARAVLVTFVEYILGTFGVSVDTMGSSFIEVISNMLLSISRFAVETAAWFSAIVSSWRLLWDNFGAIASFGISFLIDIVFNFSRLFPQAIGYAMNRAFFLVVSFVSKVIDALRQMGVAIVMFVTQIPEMIKKVISGEDISSVMAQALMAPFNAIQGMMRGIEGNAPKLDDLFAMSTRTQSKLNEVRDVFGEIAKKQQEIRKEALEQKDTAPEDKKEDQKKDNTAGDGLKSGQYGFLELGASIQKALLGDDKQDRMISLLESGNDIQRQLLETERGRAAAAQAAGGTTVPISPAEGELASLLEDGNTISIRILEALNGRPARGMLT